MANSECSHKIKVNDRGIFRLGFDNIVNGKFAFPVIGHTVPRRAANVKKYRLSFTFGGLLVPESRTIAEQYAELRDWPEVKNQVLGENLMGKTRRSTSKRYFREIRDRLSMAYSWEVDLVAGRDPGITAETDIPAVLFAIFTRYYQLTGDFVTEILRSRFFEGLTSIDPSMFRAFMGDQIPAHPEIASLSDSTREKLTTVTMRTLREAGVVSGQGRRGPFEIRRPQVSPALRDAYCRAGRREDYGHLLWPEEEIRQCLH